MHLVNFNKFTVVSNQRFSEARTRRPM